MPTIGPLHHHKPGTEAGRLACSEQRSICLSVSTTRASFAGEVQWNVSAFVAGGTAQPASRVSSVNCGRVLEMPAIPHHSPEMRRSPCLGTGHECVLSAASLLAIFGVCFDRLLITCNILR